MKKTKKKSTEVKKNTVNITLNREYYLKLSEYAKRHKRTIKGSLEIIIDRCCL